ncbi:hypothetical protein ACOJBO_32670 [Rhizobium beringeri]
MKLTDELNIAVDKIANCVRQNLPINSQRISSGKASRFGPLVRGGMAAQTAAMACGAFRKIER